MVKEATGSMDQASAIVAATDLTVLSGDDSLTLPLMAIGGRGVISVVGNIVAKDMLAMLEPVIIGLLGVMIGGIVISLYMPLFAMIAKLAG